MPRSAKTVSEHSCKVCSEGAYAATWTCHKSRCQESSTREVGIVGDFSLRGQKAGQSLDFIVRQAFASSSPLIQHVLDGFERRHGTVALRGRRRLLAQLRHTKVGRGTDDTTGEGYPERGQRGRVGWRRRFRRTHQRKWYLAPRLILQTMIEMRLVAARKYKHSPQQVFEIQSTAKMLSMHHPLPLCRPQDHLRTPRQGVPHPGHCRHPFPIPTF